MANAGDWLDLYAQMTSDPTTDTKYVPETHHVTDFSISLILFHSLAGDFKLKRWLACFLTLGCLVLANDNVCQFMLLNMADVFRFTVSVLCVFAETPI